MFSDGAADIAVFICIVMKKYNALPQKSQYRGKYYVYGNQFIQIIAPILQKQLRSRFFGTENFEQEKLGSVFREKKSVRAAFAKTCDIVSQVYKN